MPAARAGPSRPQPPAGEGRAPEALHPFWTFPQNRASLARMWAGPRAPHLRPECPRAGKPAGPPLNVGQCAAIRTGEPVMNGGNCFSLCPISRRRQKPLLPRQTMPLCGRQRPAACTSPALCEPPIAGPGSRAAAAAPWPRESHAAPRRAGPPSPGRGPGRAYGCPPSRPGAGRRLRAEAQLLQAGLPLAAPSQPPPRAGRTETSIIHTKEEVGVQRVEPAAPPRLGRECGHQRALGVRGAALLLPPPCGSGCVRGRLCSERGVDTSPGWPPRALTKASGLGHVYMMHSSREPGSWPATLLFLPERRAGRGHGGAVGHAAAG